MRLNEQVRPGDVIAVNTGTSAYARAVRAANWLAGRRWSWANHVILVHHVDAAGALWGVEGRPGGVGDVDLTSRDYAYYSSNAGQPKTDDQRAQLIALGEQVKGTPYDWEGVVADAMQALGLQHLWRSREEWPATAGGRSPAHVVCSSLWAWAAGVVGLVRPAPVKDARYVTPGDWDGFNRQWRA